MADFSFEECLSYMHILSLKVLMACFFLITSGKILRAQEKSTGNAQELANKLSNPVASLISVPLQSNVDYGMGTYHGSKYTLNIQPVIPFQLSPKLNLITRYIIPLVDQHDITGEGSNEFGLSDATVSAFFSPAANKNGIIWGAGPAILIPIGTNDYLSTRHWAAGPTLLILKQSSGFTYGFLVNQLWSFAGDKDRKDVNQMFLQPFLAYNFKSGAGLNLNSEMTFDWQNNTSAIFINPVISGITRLGTQTVSLGIGPRIPISGPSMSKPDFGLRAAITFVFPQ
jgi:hypothetical protein